MVEWGSAVVTTLINAIVIASVVHIVGAGHAFAQATAGSAVTTDDIRPESITLANVLAMLELRNRDVLVSRRVAGAARADVVTAGARANPTLTLGLAAINPRAGIGAGTIRDKTLDTYVRIDQLIERGAKRELRIGAAERVADAVSADAGDVLRQQRLAATVAYYELALSQQRVALAIASVETYDRTLAAAELRLRAGDIAQADVTRLRVDALRAQSDARQAEAERRATQLRLAYLIAFEAQSERLRAVDPWPSATSPPVENVDPWVEARADVRAAGARLEAANTARELAKRLRTRDVSVSAQYDHYPQTASNTLGSGNSVGFSISVPLFVRYYYEGEIARAEADVATATDALERARAVARAELVRAQADRRAAAAQLAQMRSALLVEARRAADFAEFSFRNGASGVMDLLDARRVLRGVELEVLTAQGEFARASAAFDSARDAGYLSTATPRPPGAATAR